MSTRASVTLPAKAKPSKVVSSDGTRPQVGSAWIRPDGDGDAVLLATDSYRMVQLPVTVDAGGDLGDGAAVPREALKAVEKTGRCEVSDDYVEPLSKGGAKNGVLFRRPTRDELLTNDKDRERGYPAWVELKWPDKPKKPFSVGINARFLFEIAQAMGTGDVVTLTFDLEKWEGGHWLQPILVEPRPPRDGVRAQVMPVRPS